MANEKYMLCTMVTDVFLLLSLPPFWKKNIFPFPFTPAKLLGGEQTISNGAANTYFLLITHQYIGATNQILPMYWCCYACKKSSKSVATIQLVLLTRFHQYNGAICTIVLVELVELVETILLVLLTRLVSSTNSISANTMKNLAKVLVFWLGLVLQF